MEALNKLLSRAKIGMLQMPDSTFLSTIVFNLNTVFSAKFPTAATNGLTLYINPTFFEGLSQSERVFLLAHEALHVAYMHMFRLDGKDHKMWNRACDYVINDHLKNAKFNVIDGSLYDRTLHGLSADAVYKILEDNNSHDPDFVPDLLEPGAKDEDDEGGDAPGMDSGRTVKSQVQDIVMQANMQVGLSGGNIEQVPEEIRRMLEDILKPKINWRTVLARFLKSMSKSDYSNKKFNRKYIQEGLYLPTLVSEGNLTRIDFAVDVSGSVTPDICNQFCSEIYSVLKGFEPEKIGVYQFGTAIAKTSIVNSLRDLMTMEFVDGGGTLISPVFEHFQKQREPKALIILTDGEIWHGDKFKKPTCNRPIIWCIYDNPNFTAPFGKVIHFNLRASGSK